MGRQRHDCGEMKKRHRATAGATSPTMNTHLLAVRLVRLGLASPVIVDSAPRDQHGEAA